MSSSLCQTFNSNSRELTYSIASKKFDREKKQYIFIIEIKGEIRFIRTAEEISKDKNILFNMNANDVYDIGFTRGCESILNEKVALLSAKKAAEGLR
ncbi:MAG: hypothetical protein EPO11_02970 [Gammaproteobacteria bacterium]|nr:MAG: hypothetical protein EPO11_02970 [Gammaproteobacteria bacterium]